MNEEENNADDDENILSYIMSLILVDISEDKYSQDES